MFIKQWNHIKIFKNKAHNVYNQEINKITLCNNDKRLETFDRITWNPYGTSAGKVYKSELLSKYKWLILMIIQIKII